MRALVFNGTELVVEQNYPQPAPVVGEALIRVLQAGICNTDLEIIRGYMGFTGVLGHEFVGVVEEIYGAEARERGHALLGKRVVGDINAACHRSDCWYCQRGMTTHCPRRTTLGIANRDGAFADYILLPVENLYVVPEDVSDEEAAFVEPLAANFEILEQVHLKPTETVLILGDGKLGQLAAQVVALGGCETIMVGKHEEKLAIVRQYGVTTYVLKDIEQSALAAIDRVDHVVECTGSAQGIELALNVIKPRGNLILKSTVSDRTTLNMASIVVNEIRVQGSRCGPFAPALRALSQKRVQVRPLISASYTLDDGLAAFKYAEQKGVLKVLLHTE